REQLPPWSSSALGKCLALEPPHQPKGCHYELVGSIGRSTRRCVGTQRRRCRFLRPDRDWYRHRRRRRGRSSGISLRGFEDMLLYRLLGAVSETIGSEPTIGKCILNVRSSLRR